MTEWTFKALGSKGNLYSGLETFPKPQFCTTVTLITDEVTAVCPVTGQPDWYTVRVLYEPSSKCIESKSFKLFIHSLREKGMFCEALADYILNEVVKVTEPNQSIVKVIQKPRGGVSIESVSEYSRE